MSKLFATKKLFSYSIEKVNKGCVIQGRHLELIVTKTGRLLELTESLKKVSAMFSENFSKYNFSAKVLGEGNNRNLSQQKFISLQYTYQYNS